MLHGPRVVKIIFAKLQIKVFNFKYLWLVNLISCKQWIVHRNLYVYHKPGFSDKKENSTENLSALNINLMHGSDFPPEKENLFHSQYHYTRGNDIAANATNSQYQ